MPGPCLRVNLSLAPSPRTPNGPAPLRGSTSGQGLREGINSVIVPLGRPSQCTVQFCKNNHPPRANTSPMYRIHSYELKVCCHCGLMAGKMEFDDDMLHGHVRSSLIFLSEVLYTLVMFTELCRSQFSELCRNQFSGLCQNKLADFSAAHHFSPIFCAQTDQVILNYDSSYLYGNSARVNRGPSIFLAQ